MLCITRTHGEGIVLDVKGERIVVHVLDIQGGRRVRLGFEARRDVTIMRSELVGGRNGADSKSPEPGA